MTRKLRNSRGRWSRVDAQRTSTDPRDPDARRIHNGPRTIAGVSITPDTAVTISAVWACLRYLSQTVAVLPWHVMQDGDRGAQIQRANPVDWLIYKRPNPEWSSFQFRETMTHWALRYGNGYAEIERDQAGRPFALWPIHPERVEVCRDVDTGRLFYEVCNDRGGEIELDAQDVFHMRGFGEGVVGVNVIEYAAQSLGWARAAQIFGAAFFGNGATPSTVVINKKALSEAGLELQRKEFEELYKGPWRAGRTAHLDNDADIKAIGLDIEKTQLIEIHQYLIEEITRWFGVPPHKVMHLIRSSYNSVEHQSIEVVVDSVSPWVKRFEDEADFKLFGQNRRGLYTKMNMNALLRGDMKSRMEFYKGMHFVGAYSPNRILELEDENTLGPDGDIHVMQQQMVPLEFIAKGPEQAAAGGEQNAAPMVEESADPLTEDAEAVAARVAAEAWLEFA